MLGAQFNAGRFEAEVFRVGVAAGRDQRLIGFDTEPSDSVTRNAPSRVFSIAVGKQPNRWTTPVLRHRVAHPVAHVLVEAA